MTVDSGPCIGETDKAGKVELLPCPFCGEVDRLIDRGVGDEDGGYFEISCPNCNGARACFVGIHSDDRETAVRQWNTRAPVTRHEGTEVADTYLVGGPDLKAMSGSVESDRVIQLHFRRRATDDDRKWLLDAINEKIARERDATPPNVDDATQSGVDRVLGPVSNKEIVQRMHDTFKVTGDRWFLLAAQRLASLTPAREPVAWSAGVKAAADLVSDMPFFDKALQRDLVERIGALALSPQASRDAAK